MQYVYSTATSGLIYTQCDTSTKGPARILKKVEIKGGHGVATIKNLHTPKGIVTVVSDGDLEWLLTNKTFKKHIDEGWISYDKKEFSPEKKAKDMADKDGSAPLTPSDFVEGSNSTRENKVYAPKNKPATL
jgi:hypothetical protein